MEKVTKSGCNNLGHSCSTLPIDGNGCETKCFENQKDWRTLISYSRSTGEGHSWRRCLNSYLEYGEQQVVQRRMKDRSGGGWTPDSVKQELRQ